MTGLRLSKVGKSQTSLALLLLAAIFAPYLFPSSTLAVSRKVAIGDFRWSLPTVQIDRGEAVSWHWIGPDTQHSITELSPVSGRIDSDPGEGIPQHEIGDRFRLTFDTPGTFRFHCKIHALVGGTVVVSDLPGNPLLDPDPDPLLYVDRRPPKLTKLRIAPRKGKQVSTFANFTLDEAGTFEVDIYRLKGRRGIKYLGLRRFSAHVGLNEIKLDPKGKRRRPLPIGRYRAEVRAIDLAINGSKQREINFTIGSKQRSRS